MSPARTLPAKNTEQTEPSPQLPVRHSFEQGTREILSLKESSSNNKAEQAGKKDDDSDAKTSSADSASTVRPKTSRTGGTVKAQLSTEEHVAKGIQCHENGSLNESTYHLRIAAMQNHPTGMLLYALACRHGWGMRPNQREGVQWLRKAVDSAGLNVANYDSSSIEPRGRNIQEQKTRQAQFALSIYELGVSHLNGWGIEQDKSLALRCFEIAGHWGDADALSEAGYCYVEGIGCKKDMKKAAKFYRLAESKGVNMVGNSWYVPGSFSFFCCILFWRQRRLMKHTCRIYKEKYMSEDKSSASKLRHKPTNTSDKKSRNKSRTRSIFTRKQSVAASTP